MGDRKQSIFGFQGGALSVFNSLIGNSEILKEDMKTKYHIFFAVAEHSINLAIKHNFIRFTGMDITNVSLLIIWNMIVFYLIKYKVLSVL